MHSFIEVIIPSNAAKQRFENICHELGLGEVKYEGRKARIIKYFSDGDLQAAKQLLEGAGWKVEIR
jgi:hypothetical protein